MPPFHSNPGDPIPQDSSDLDEEICVGAGGPGLADSKVTSLIRAMKGVVPAIAAVEPSHLWRAFCACNRRRGHERVPLRWLAGFLRKWRGKSEFSPRTSPAPGTGRTDPSSAGTEEEHVALIHWHGRDAQQRELCRRIGAPAYAARITAAAVKHGYSTFRARLFVHGAAIRAGEIAP